jgi:hypothetical protein
MSAECYLAMFILIAACAKPSGEVGRASEKFHCLSVGNETARECLRSANDCRKGLEGPRSCFEQERAFCFSKAPALVFEGGPARITICTPTRDECTAWSDSFRKTSPDTMPSGCVDTARREVWQ